MFKKYCQCLFCLCVIGNERKEELMTDRVILSYYGWDASMGRHIMLSVWSISGHMVNLITISTSWAETSELPELIYTNISDNHNYRSDQIRSVAQSCPTLCDPMNCSTPGLLVHHQLPEFTQTHVHRVSDAIQPSHLCRPLLLLPPIPPSIRVFSSESTFRMRWPKDWSFSLASFLPKKSQGWSPSEYR